MTAERRLPSSSAGAGTASAASRATVARRQPLFRWSLHRLTAVRMIQPSHAPERKSLGLLEQLEKDRLADILGVVGALEVGVAQAEDQVGIGVHQPFGLPAVQCDGHVSHILCH